MNHRKGYPSAEEAMRSKAFLTVPGAFLDLSCPCGEIHVQLPKDAPVPLARIPRERKAPKDAGPSPAVRKLVLDRDGCMCLRCGIFVIGRPYSLHHRKKRSQLGRNDPENLITLCGSGTTGCHGWVHANLNDAHDAGWIVRSGEDPALMPLEYISEHGSGFMALLTRDGGRMPSERGAA